MSSRPLLDPKAVMGVAQWCLLVLLTLTGPLLLCAVRMSHRRVGVLGRKTLVRALDVVVHAIHFSYFWLTFAAVLYLMKGASDFVDTTTAVLILVVVTVAVPLAHVALFGLVALPPSDGHTSLLALALADLSTPHVLGGALLLCRTLVYAIIAVVVMDNTISQNGAVWLALCLLLSLGCAYPVMSHSLYLADSAAVFVETSLLVGSSLKAPSFDEDTTLCRTSLCWWTFASVHFVVVQATTVIALHRLRQPMLLMARVGFVARTTRASDAEVSSRQPLVPRHRR